MRLISRTVSLLLVGVALIASAGWLLCDAPGPHISAAQVLASPTPVGQPASTPTVKVQSIPSLPTPTPDSVSPADLVEHFERVTDFTMKIISTVVALLGIIGIVAGYFSLKTITELQKLTLGFEERIRGIEDRVEETDEQLRTMIGEAKDQTEDVRKIVNEAQVVLNEAYARTSDATSRLRYLLEARDANPEVRIRAAQQLGQSNDITATSILTGLLEDESADVRAEAAYGLGRLLSTGGEPNTLMQGIQSLVEGTKDADSEVRVESIQALDAIVSDGGQLPRFAVQRLRDIVEYDVIARVREAARTVLDHLGRGPD